MKKILLLAYYYPPCSSIGATRPESFAKNFAEHGLYPTVITRHWKGDENLYEDYQQPDFTPAVTEDNDSHRVIYLPYFGKINRINRLVNRFKPAGKLLLYLMTAKGIFSPEINAHEAFYRYLRVYLKENPQDYILATSPPINSIRLGSQLAKEFNIPFIADFRDLWNIHLTDKNYNPTKIRTRIFNDAFKLHIKKWLKTARLIVSVSNPLLEEIAGLGADKKMLLVMNGYEENLFDEHLSSENKTTPKFTFSIVGSLFQRQDLSIMLDGLNRFLKNKDLSKIQLNFIGVSHTPDVAARISSQLPGKCTLITPRIPRRKAVEKIVESNVLFYPAWKGFKGIVSGKIFEYMGSGRNILIAPTDDDVIEDLITETRSGKTTDSVEEFVKIMNGWYEEWEAQGFLDYKGDWEKIRYYTRENQARILAENILKI